MNINHHKLGLGIAAIVAGSLLGLTSAAEARVPCDAHGTEPCAEPSGGGASRPQVVDLAEYEYTGDVKDHPLYRRSGPEWTGDTKDHPLYRSSGPEWTGDTKDHPLYRSNSANPTDSAVDFNLPCASRPTGPVDCAE